MIKLIDLTYYAHRAYTRPGQVLENHAPALNFSAYINGRLQFTFIKHASFEQHVTMDGIPYYFFKGFNKFWYVSFKTHLLINKLKPDIVLVQGLVFPLQVFFLRFFCGKNLKIIIQHHGELPFNGIKGHFQKMACKMVNAYMFTSADNALVWKKRNIIKQNAQIFELLEASTSFKPVDKSVSKKFTGVNGDINLLWVGHLNGNKDPLTVLNGFEYFLNENSGAKLYMIYQSTGLLKEVKAKLASNVMLQNAVVLVGEVANVNLPYWYSAADIYISGSKKEGSGYALLEAMACGCIPVVTAIPSYQKITENGKYGFLFPHGDGRQLGSVLTALEKRSKESLSVTTLTHFNKNLSFKKIADDLVEVCKFMSGK